MENSVVKFSLRARNAPNGGDPHWNYCCSNRIPYITIRKSGTKYWKVDYNILPVVIGERFTVLSFDDFTASLYDRYCTEHNFTSKGNHRLGNLGGSPLAVYKEDAPEFANKLFDLLVRLLGKDKELFDKNPFYINEDGYNSEGFHVAKYSEDLEQMSDQELIKEYQEMKKDKPFWLQTIQLIKKEMNKRKKLKDLSDQELRSLSAKESGELSANAFYKNLNSQPKKK